MNKSKKILAFLCLALALVRCGLISSSKPENVISLELKRVQVDPWIKNSTIPESSCYNPSEMESDYIHEYDIQRPQQCESVQSYVKIMTQCIYVTTAYQADFKFGKDATPFKMVLDLRTPWSWIKNPSCQQYSRKGAPASKDCSYPSKIKGATEQTLFNKTYKCEGNCKPTQNKCAEIDLVQEGLSVFGEFINVEAKLSDKSYKKSVKGFKVISAYGLSGQQFLLGDGVLGLGKQHTGKADDADDNEEEETFNKNNKLNEDDEENEDEEDEENDDEQEEEKEEEKKDNKKSKKSYTFFEHGTDLWSAIDRTTGKINANVFALYLADHDSYKPQLLIGNNTISYTELIHSPEKHPLKWVPLARLKYDSQEELARSYFQWRIPINQIVFRYGQIIEKEDKNDKVIGYHNRTEILLKKETEAQLSLQTSAMILPQVELDQILSKLNEIYDTSCALSKNFIKYVSCTNLPKPLDVSQLAITIHVGYGKGDDQMINVDPNNLLLGCKKNSKKSFDCYLNLQLSLDDQIIFGDSVMRESYWVFDVNGRKVGLAPAKSKYNDKSFWREIKTIIADVEDVIRGDIIFLLRFFLVLIVLSTILFVFVNWKKIYQIVQRRLRYKNIVDPSELANLDLDKSDMVIKYGQTDDQEVSDQIQELEQNESFDAL